MITDPLDDATTTDRLCGDYGAHSTEQLHNETPELSSQHQTLPSPPQRHAKNGGHVHRSQSMATTTTTPTTVLLPKPQQHHTKMLPPSVRRHSDSSIGRCPTTAVVVCPNKRTRLWQTQKQEEDFNATQQRQTPGPVKPGFTRAETLILFDWDDTLLPSSWLAARKLGLASRCPNPEEQAYLDAISDRVCSLLLAAVRYGRVIVVTNAEAGWVEMSGSRFLPRVLDTLRTWHVSIVSARSAFQATKRRLPFQWKSKAFQHLLGLAYPIKNNGLRCNVVSFGDSNSERLALIESVTRQAAERPGQSSFYKSFKLCEHPTPVLLQRQLLLVEQILPRMIHHAGNLDLRVNLKECSMYKRRRTRGSPVPLSSSDYPYC